MAGIGTPAPMMFGVFVTARELLGVSSTLTDIERLLRTVPRSLATTIITALCSSGQTTEDVLAADDTARQLLLSPDLSRRFTGLERSARKIAFHRPQLLAGLQLVQRLCYEESRVLDGSERRKAHESLGEALIRISDFLNDPSLTNLNEWQDLAPLLLPLYLQNNPSPMLLAVRRTHAMLSDLRWRSDSRLSNAALRFEQTLGLSPRDYMLFLMGLVVKASGRKGSTEMPLHLGPVLRKAKSSVAIRRVLASLSIPYSELPKRVAEPVEVVSRFPPEPFRSKPLIELPGDRYWPVDLPMLTDRMLAGVFWAIMEATPINEREPLIAAWGDLFEGFLTARLASGLGRAYRGTPTDVRGTQITDGIVIDKPDLIFLEFKASLLRDHVKDGRTFGPLAEEIEKKLTKNGQLARAIRRFLDDDLSTTMLTKTRATIYPVIVALDRSAASPFLSRVADESFQKVAQTLRLDRVTLASLTLISADDAEAMIPLVQNGKKLRSILGDSLASDPERSTTFHNHLVGHATRMGVSLMGESRNEYREAFDAAKEFWQNQSTEDLLGTI